MRPKLGVLLLGTLVVAAGAYAGAQSWPRRSTIPLIPQYAPDPDNLWRFTQDGSTQPFVVPARKNLVITEMCVDQNWLQSFLTINGDQVGSSWPACSPDGTIVFDQGIVAHAGDLVDFLPVSANSHFVAAAGYLVDQLEYPLTVRLPYIPSPSDIVFIEM